MAILSKGQTFANADSITSTKLNNLVDAATFVAGSSGTTDNASLEVNGSGRLQVKDLGVTSAKLSTDAVTTGKILDDAVTQAKLADDSVGTAQIIDNSITNALVADSAIDTAELADGAVETIKINDAAVTAPKLSGAQTGTAPVYGVRAWVAFDANRNAAGTADTTNTTRYLIASGNVTSVTKTATGKYTVLITTALPDANYSYFTAAQADSSNEPLVYRQNSGTKSTTQFQIETQTRSGSLRDFNEVCISFIR
jgi:hypothetical protein